MDTTIWFAIGLIILYFNVLLIRKIFCIHEIIENQKTLITLLAGLALKMEVDEHFFPKVKQYDQPPIHPLRKMFSE